MKKKTISALTLALTAATLTLSACGTSTAAAAAPAEAAPAITAAAESSTASAGTIETIMNAGTTQAFSDEAVPAEDIQTILQAGLAAESAINQQPWYFVAVTNKDVMAELSASAGMPGGEGMPSMPKDGEAPSMPKDGEAPAMPDGGEMPAAPEGMEMPEGFPGGAPGAGGAGTKASLGDSPLAIIVYMDRNTSSPSPEFDCGLAVQNMYIAAASLGYGAKIVSSPTMTLNGANHDEICEKLGVDSSLTAVAVLLVGKADESVDSVSSASVRAGSDGKTAFIE